MTTRDVDSRKWEEVVGYLNRYCEGWSWEVPAGEYTSYSGWCVTRRGALRSMRKAAADIRSGSQRERVVL